MTPDNLTHPRLARGAQIIPCPSEWLVKRGDGLTRIGDSAPLSSKRRLLTLLDGGHGIAALCEGTGLDTHDLGSLIGRLADLGLIEDQTRPMAAAIDRKEYFSAAPLETTGISAPIKLLLIGLGELGLAVLRDLLRHDNVAVEIFDPVPVEARDIHPFYRPGEVGREKADIVRQVLGDRSAGKITARPAGSLVRSAVEAALQSTLSDADAASVLFGTLAR